jgi:adenine-specific DNA-methyltransferase
MGITTQKCYGAYYTPSDAVRSLVRWAVRRKSDQLLDPSCGDGRFLMWHRPSVGIEQDPKAFAIAHERAPWSVIHERDFFTWADETEQRFECAAGNPPFIRYQRFAGHVRERALRRSAQLGVTFTALTSSWAPFLVVTASLLKLGGRMAFVVPAEIGHCQYAPPLIRYFLDHFDTFHLVAVQQKIFPELSEDVWLLYADGFGGSTEKIFFTALDTFSYSECPPQDFDQISSTDWASWGSRLRPFLLPSNVRDAYRSLADAPTILTLGKAAKVGIGYVTGANDFFHLRPSQAESVGIPPHLLRPAVRNGRALTQPVITKDTVSAWRQRDEPILLLHLPKDGELPDSVQRYLESKVGQAARETYKCRNRTPWYVVPDVTVPDGFLSYMSGSSPALVMNAAGCVGTNSVHTVKLRNNTAVTFPQLQAAWTQPLTALSCEIEGHPLGGGLLKLEPSEASSIRLLTPGQEPDDRRAECIQQGVEVMKRWRHCHG